MRQTLSRFFPAILEIEAPGTLDGGDICEAEDHFFLGLSHRTNEEGAGSWLLIWPIRDTPLP